MWLRIGNDLRKIVQLHAEETIAKIVTTPWKRVLFNSLKKKKSKNAIVQCINFPYDYDFIVYFQIYWNNSSFRINKLFHDCC